MRIKEAIVLAGGLGTRIKDTLPGIPKCMAPVNGRPFLEYVIKHLQAQGIKRFIFALAHQPDLIINYVSNNASWLNARYSLEEHPLGTGGAIIKALELATEADLLVLNGDTLFKAAITPLSDQHFSSSAICTLALKQMNDCGRYGTVSIDNNQRVTGFGEKNNTLPGLINGGNYILNKEKFMAHHWPASFSFEHDFLQAKHATEKIMGNVQDAYFIDIGIPEDYELAKRELNEK